MKKALILTVLSAVSASAQMGGDFGMMGSRMMTYSPLWSIAFGAFWLGLLLLIWLWVIKLWKEVRKMK